MTEEDETDKIEICDGHIDSNESEKQSEDIETNLHIVAKMTKPLEDDNFVPTDEMLMMEIASEIEDKSISTCFNPEVNEPGYPLPENTLNLHIGENILDLICEQTLLVTVLNPNDAGAVDVRTETAKPSEPHVANIWGLGVEQQTLKEETGGSLVNQIEETVTESPLSPNDTKALLTSENSVRSVVSSELTDQLPAMRDVPIATTVEVFTITATSNASLSTEFNELQTESNVSVSSLPTGSISMINPPSISPPVFVPISAVLPSAMKKSIGVSLSVVTTETPRSLSPSLNAMVSPAAARGQRTVSFSSKRTSTPQQLLKAMMKEAVADSKAYAEVRHLAEEEQVEYEYISAKEVAALDNITGGPAPVPFVPSKSPAELSFDQQRRKAVRKAELQLKKRLNGEREAAARAAKKAQEDLLLSGRSIAPSYGFSNIKAGLKLHDYHEHKKLSAVVAATSAAGIVLNTVSQPPLPYYMTLGREAVETSSTTVSKEISGDSLQGNNELSMPLTVTIDGAVSEPLTDDDEEGETMQVRHQRRLRKEAAQQQSDVQEAISDNLIDQRFGWNRNYHTGTSAQQRSQADVTSGSLPPTAKITPKASMSSPMGGNSTNANKKGGASLLGKLPQPTSLPPLTLMPLKVSVSTITSNDAPEFVYHLRKRLSCEQLQFDQSLSGGQQRMDSDSLDGMSLSESHTSTSTSSSHYRIVNTSTAHLPRISRLESIPDSEEAAPPDSLSSLLDGERRSQLLEQLKRSVYVDPSRDISWRLTGMLKEGPKYGSSRPHFEMDVFEHSMNLRAGKLLNAYRPWSHVKTDDFDFDHFQAVMQEAAVTEKSKVLAPIISPKQHRGHRGGKKNLYGAVGHKKNQNSNSARSLHHHLQTHQQSHSDRMHSEETLSPLKGSPSKPKTSHHQTAHMTNAHHSPGSTHSSTDSTVHDHDGLDVAMSRCDSFLSDADGEEMSPASKAIGRRHQKHSLPIIINVIKVVPV